MSDDARSRLCAVASVVLLLSLTGCGMGAPVSESSTPNSSERPPFLTATPGPIAPSGTPTDVSPVRWDAITADLASRGSTEEIVLVSAESITWPNGALGCPVRGRSYTQSLVNGMRVIVMSEGTSYDYRFGSGDQPVLCES